MAEPFTTLAVIGGLKAASTIAKGTGKYLSARQIFDDEDEERLAALQRLREEGGLGLTDAEQQRLGSRLTRPILGAERQGRDVLASQQAIADVGAGAAAKQQAQITGQVSEAKGKVGQAIEEQQRIAEKQDLAEMAMLREKKKAESMGKYDALFGGFSEGLSDYGGYLKAQHDVAQQKLMMEAIQAAEERKKFGYKQVSLSSNETSYKMFSKKLGTKDTFGGK
jgi:hypothetical protein